MEGCPSRSLRTSYMESVAGSTLVDASGTAWVVRLAEAVIDGEASLLANDTGLERRGGLLSRFG